MTSYREIFRNKHLKYFGFGLIILVVLLAGIVTIFKLTGHNLGIRSQVSSIKNVVLAVSDSRNITSQNQGKFSNIIFLHHSVGNNLIEQGNVRDAFTNAGYHFWDHDYNSPGLTDPLGNIKEYNFSVPDDNTDINGLATIFNQPVYSLPINTFSALLQYEVIIIKSCYPNSDISSDEMLVRNKTDYLSIRDVMDKHPDKLFIILTTPPLNPAATNLETAARARLMADWLKSDEFLKGHSNIAVFDFFSYLVNDDPVSSEFNMLKKEYRDGSDSHPNHIANEFVGPIFTQFIINAIDFVKVH